MAVAVRYFASLRERMGRPGDSVDASEVSTIADVWQRVSGNLEMPANTLVALNMEYVDPVQRVTDGDEIAFFPRVTGG
jgi:molybdopterin synthase sulfur carrier subunit